LPGQTQGITGTLMTALPNLMALLCAAFLIWKLRSRANPFGLPFLLAAAAATPLVALATGGEVIDRFSFPFHIPALLLFAGVLLAAAKANTPSPRWLWAGRALLVVWIIAILYVWQVKSHMYRLYEHRILAAVGIMPRYLEKFELNLSDSVMNAEAERARRVQQTLPAGVQALEAALYAYPYDFHRNTIYIADYPGMAGWAPGIPVGQGPEPVRAYFISHGIHYFICDRRLTHNNEDIGDFLKQPGISIPAKNFLLHPASTHFNTGWSREEDSVSRDVRHNLLTLAESDDKLYDDGTVVAVHLRER